MVLFGRRRTANGVRFGLSTACTANAETKKATLEYRRSTTETFPPPHLELPLPILHTLTRVRLFLLRRAALRILRLQRHVQPRKPRRPDWRAGGRGRCLRTTLHLFFLLRSNLCFSLGFFVNGFWVRKQQTKKKSPQLIYFKLFNAICIQFNVHKSPKLLQVGSRPPITLMCLEVGFLHI